MHHRGPEGVDLHLIRGDSDNLQLKVKLFSRSQRLPRLLIDIVLFLGGAVKFR